MTFPFLPAFRCVTWAILLLTFLVGLTPGAGGRIFCIQADGHVTLEACPGHHACCDAAPDNLHSPVTAIRSTRAESPCCTDVPLNSIATSTSAPNSTPRLLTHAIPPQAVPFQSLTAPATSAPIRHPVANFPPPSLFRTSAIILTL